VVDVVLLLQGRAAAAAEACVGRVGGARAWLDRGMSAVPRRASGLEG